MAAITTVRAAWGFHASCTCASWPSHACCGAAHMTQQYRRQQRQYTTQAAAVQEAARVAEQATVCQDG